MVISTVMQEVRGLCCDRCVAARQAVGRLLFELGFHACDFDEGADRQPTVEKE
jgi:hypothetical protein